MMRTLLTVYILTVFLCSGAGYATQVHLNSKSKPSEAHSKQPTKKAIKTISKTAKNKSSHNSKPKVNLTYSSPISKNKFLVVDIRFNNHVVRVLKSKKDIGGAFERDSKLRLSPNHRFLFLSQIESAELATPTGTVIKTRPYCNIVETRTGCIIARETGRFCGGKFKPNNIWENPIYPHFKIAKSIPTAKDYVSGEMSPSGTPETSFQNLKKCDPVNIQNAADYSHLIKNNIFDLSESEKANLINKIRKSRNSY